MKGIWITTLMVGGALAAGGGAAYFAKGYINNEMRAEREQLHRQYQLVNVVVAKANLAAGAVLSSQTVALREVPQTFLHADAVRSGQWADIAGRVLSRSVRSGETILNSHLAHGVGAGFSALLADGMRALTLPVDEEASIAGMLAPGDRIDLLFTTAAGNDSVTVPLLSTVPVIATGVRTEANSNSLPERLQSAAFRNITVAVSPSDAARITLAQEAGRITVALRQPNDQDRAHIARVTKSSLLSADEPTRQSRSRTRVQIILGGV
ncbi:Flp pilus assembly protein CpaB [Steroidobacter sp. S1-65]|uniref:Flp pilus assembly protein CpaB n=1 Tax=Steroidobacter gossypii TaxID=2805490 RepID=A0ABS1WSY5_9GAMM|nr:Flp pilus assembly protein CpaB [Steroidobacter gossypii]MBM0104096.1 Flp pilus assembly protein CpaB [Steroidobacter gossypii]